MEGSDDERRLAPIYSDDEITAVEAHRRGLDARLATRLAARRKRLEERRKRLMQQRPTLRPFRPS